MRRVDAVVGGGNDFVGSDYEVYKGFTSVRTMAKCIDHRRHTRRQFDIREALA